MIDLWVVLGAVGSIASLIGLLLPPQSKSQRLMHAAYGLAIALFASAAVWYWQANQRFHKVEQAASRLLSDFEYNYSTEGIVQASLAFLEKNKDLYPDSYVRAQEICKQNNCLGPKYTKESANGVDHEYNQRNVASALQGLIKGISALESYPQK
ncbi:hypothetical protein BSZ31_15505 [Limnobacter sp. SAORIC-690]|uniref:hypothetical protein n=1 Tax=unclassified Limnobacter TaxID=2630203 RepID=UPI000CF53EC1|nr:hypothetical protein [Limnobacter sp. SAORIC-690]PQJ26145.1 hypothetical protein BSZ31_15505 [Limnobacter sp. SAORIC-690]